MKTLFRIALLSLALPLQACLTLTSSEEPPAIYNIHPRQDGAAVSAVASGTMEVPKPSVPAGFDRDQIALYWDSGRRLDYFASARWPAPLDEMFQDMIMRSAQYAFPNMSIVAPDADLPARYRLAVRVLDFEPVYAGAPSGAPQLYAAFKVMLIALPEERVLADTTVTARKQAAGSDLTSLASGLEGLAQELLQTAFRTLGGAMRQEDGPPDIFQAAQ